MPPRRAGLRGAIAKVSENRKRCAHRGHRHEPVHSTLSNQPAPQLGMLEPLQFSDTSDMTMKSDTARVRFSGGAFGEFGRTTRRGPRSSSSPPGGSAPRRLTASQRFHLAAFAAAASTPSSLPLSIAAHVLAAVAVSVLPVASVAASVPRRRLPSSGRRARGPVPRTVTGAAAATFSLHFTSTPSGTPTAVCALSLKAVASPRLASPQWPYPSCPCPWAWAPRAAAALTSILPCPLAHLPTGHVNPPRLDDKGR